MHRCISDIWKCPASEQGDFVRQTMCGVSDPVDSAFRYELTRLEPTQAFVEECISNAGLRFHYSGLSANWELSKELVRK